MNNITWGKRVLGEYFFGNLTKFNLGDESHGYYETVAGGAGKFCNDINYAMTSLKY